MQKTRLKKEWEQARFEISDQRFVSTFIALTAIGAIATFVAMLFLIRIPLTFEGEGEFGYQMPSRTFSISVPTKVNYKSVRVGDIIEPGEVPFLFEGVSAVSALNEAKKATDRIKSLLDQFGYDPDSINQKNLTQLFDELAIHQKILKTIASQNHSTDFQIAIAEVRRTLDELHSLRTLSADYEDLLKNRKYRLVILQDQLKRLGRVSRKEMLYKIREEILIDIKNVESEILRAKLSFSENFVQKRSKLSSTLTNFSAQIIAQKYPSVPEFPISVRILRIHVQSGELVKEHSPIFDYIPTNQTIHAVIRISEKDVVKLKNSTKVLLEPAALPKEKYGYIPGKVVEFRPTNARRLAGETRRDSSFEVIVSVSTEGLTRSQQDSLLIGMGVKGHFLMSQPSLFKFVQTELFKESESEDETQKIHRGTASDE